MRILKNPPPSEWPALCRRPELPRQELDGVVRDIMDRVRREGDKALLEFTHRFDKASLDTLTLPPETVAQAERALPDVLKQAIRTAHANIRMFHAEQRRSELVVETMNGVTCKRVPRPIQSVGLYIPGGSAPLFSTVLMLGIPAQLAGCKEIILCTPPAPDGSIHPAILFAASCCGITKVYRCGGAQAIAAMAYGTETVPAVNKIFGPGNQYVTCAKQLAAANGVAIDMPAGPSEVLVIADETADPDFIASDLLSQAEHGPDSQVVLLTNSTTLPDAVMTSLKRQLDQLPRKVVAGQALGNSLCVVLEDLTQCLAFSDVYAPEHLILNCREAPLLVSQVNNAGSVFVGPYTPESAGDYASGTNHTLPTGGHARALSGVSVDTFTRYMTIQEISTEGLRLLGPVVATMAEAEQLDAHARAVTIRLNKLP